MGRGGETDSVLSKRTVIIRRGGGGDTTNRGEKGVGPPTSSVSSPHVGRKIQGGRGGAEQKCAPIACIHKEGGEGGTQPELRAPAHIIQGVEKRWGSPAGRRGGEESGEVRQQGEMRSRRENTQR